MIGTPPPQPVNTLAQHTYNFLHQRGFPILPFRVGSIDLPSGTGARVTMAPGQQPLMSFAPDTDIESLAGRVGTRAPLNNTQLTAANRLLHEGLHMMAFARDPHAFNDGASVGSRRFWEDAAVESVARDLMPHYTRQMFGHKMRVPKNGEAYGQRVRMLRQLSTFGSGAPNWRHPTARRWRNQFLAAPDRRQQMLDSATEARARWGQETGR